MISEWGVTLPSATGWFKWKSLFFHDPQQQQHHHHQLGSLLDLSATAAGIKGWNYRKYTYYMKIMPFDKQTRESQQLMQFLRVCKRPGKLHQNSTTWQFHRLLTIRQALLSRNYSMFKRTRMWTAPLKLCDFQAISLLRATHGPNGSNNSGPYLFVQPGRHFKCHNRDKVRKGKQISFPQRVTTKSSTLSPSDCSGECS